MFQYSVKRILIMIPTFFVVSIVIFLVLNLAPGRPGQAGSDDGGPTDQEQGNVRESYRIFKEQFNLDKPAFVNTRFSIERRRSTSRSPMCLRSSRRCTVMQSAPPSSASWAARTGSGSCPRRACRSVAT